jgi:hypothetical protein
LRFFAMLSLILLVQVYKHRALIYQNCYLKSPLLLCGKLQGMARPCVPCSCASATMDEVIYSAPSRPWMKSSIVLAARSFSVPILATMDEVIYSAPSRPWMKSSIVLAALLKRDWSSYPFQIGTLVCFAAFALHICTLFYLKRL